jgi:cell division protein FtsW (lipid II flippase)
VQRVILFGCLAAVAYLVLYALALFIYDKATVELEFLKSRSLSVVAALVVAAAISFFAPTKWNQRLWPGWVCVVPIGALAVLAYYLTPYFTR